MIISARGNVAAVVFSVGPNEFAGMCRSGASGSCIELFCTN